MERVQDLQAIVNVKTRAPLHETPFNKSVSLVLTFEIRYTNIAFFWKRGLILRLFL